MTIKMLYKCACMQDDGSFDMRDRRTDENVVDYMEEVVAKLTNDHRKRNPLCTATKVEYLKLPVAKDKGIGES